MKASKVWMDTRRFNDLTAEAPVLSAEQRRIRRELNDATFAMEQRTMFGKPPRDMKERDADEAWAIATDTKIQALRKAVK